MQYKKYISQVGISAGGVTFEAPGGLSKVTPDKAGYLGSNIVKFGITSLLILALLLSLFFLIWGGITWIMSGGDKAGVEAARNKIIYAIVGLVLVFLSFFIISVIGQMFGVTLIGL